MAGRTKFQFPVPLNDMPQYFSPSFHPSIHTAPVEPNGSRRCPVGRPLPYEFEKVAASPSRPRRTPTSVLTALSLDDKLRYLGQCDQATFMEQVWDALKLFIGRRHGEYRLRDELRRGLRPWGDFHAGLQGGDFIERVCKVSFNVWVEVWDGVNPPEEMPLAFHDHAPDRHHWKPSEQRTSMDFVEPPCKVAFIDERVHVWNCIDPPEVIRPVDVKHWSRFVKRASDFEQRSYFCFCSLEFEAALVAWPWGEDAVILMERVEAICVEMHNRSEAYWQAICVERSEAYWQRGFAARGA